MYRISSYKGRIQINACLNYRPGGLRVSKEINARSRIKARAIIRISPLVVQYVVSLFFSFFINLGGTCVFV